MSLLEFDDFVIVAPASIVLTPSELAMVIWPKFVVSCVIVKLEGFKSAAIFVAIVSAVYVASAPISSAVTV